MAGNRPTRAAKERASASFKQFLPPPGFSDDSDGDTFKPEPKKKTKHDEKDSRSQKKEISKALSINEEEEDEEPDDDESYQPTTAIESRKDKGKGRKKDMEETLTETMGRGTRKQKKVLQKRKSQDCDDDEGSRRDSDEDPRRLRGTRQVRPRQYFLGEYNPTHAQAPLLPLVHSIMTQEETAARNLAFLALDHKRDDETYRWPVREELLPGVPKARFVDDTDYEFFEKQGMGFVEELTGVPKTEDDYSGTEGSSQEGENEVEDVDFAYEVEEEQLLNERRTAKRKRKAEKRLHKERHADERDANDRLEGVHRFLKDEFTALAQEQYRKGIPSRTKDLYALQQAAVSPYRVQAARATIGESKAGDEQEDQLTQIQANAARFEAEDSMRKILDRLPYVIRQGALGHAPDYVTLGLPKPVSSEAEYERGWDTIMTAASISGIDDRILKKVSLRMKNLLSLSRNPKYFERPSKAGFVGVTVATEDDLRASEPQ